MARAYIALGSNLGNRQYNCEHVVERLRCHPERSEGSPSAVLSRDPSPPAQDDTITVLRTSPWYSTKAVTLDGKPQPDYCNGVIAIETNLSPEDLLERCRKIERELGRVRNEDRWQSRVIDLDILLYNDVVMATDVLTLPHPEMTKRLFVLEPLCAIAPDVRHPICGMTIKELLNERKKHSSPAPVPRLCGG